MKLIIAYIQPERLNAVKQALFAREIYKMSATNALGCGKQGGYLHLYRGAVEEVTLHKKMRLAIGVNDDYKTPTPPSSSSATHRHPRPAVAVFVFAPSPQAFSVLLGDDRT